MLLRNPNGRTRPFDANSPVVIPSPTLPPTPQPNRTKRSTVHGVADEVLPAGLVVRGTPPLQGKSPIGNPNDIGTPRMSKPHGSPLPLSATELAVRAALSNPATKNALMAEMVRILEDPSKRLPVNPGKRTGSGCSPAELLMNITRMIAPPPFVSEDGEVASLVHGGDIGGAVKTPKPAPTSALHQKNIDTLQQSFPASTRRLQRSTNSAFSESSRSTHQ